MGGGRGLVGGVSEEEESLVAWCGEVNRRGERDLGAVKPRMLDIDRDGRVVLEDRSDVFLLAKWYVEAISVIQHKSVDV